jgi:hypothetical protein
MASATPTQSFVQGQTVRIRSASEIAATLDALGRLEGLPFMPEMVPLCGRTATVHRNVDKTCVEGYGLRLMTDAVLLEGLRCDGSSHDGCQRGCMFFWKQAWLAPVEEEEKPHPFDGPAALELLANLPTMQHGLYLCQSTALYGATLDMSRWNLTHFFREIRRGELTYPGFMQILLRTGFDRIFEKFGLRGLSGLTGKRKRTLRGNLNLQAGERVEVLSREEIEATLDASGKNAGLSFEPGMAAFHGQQFHVERPLRRIILEQHGTMRTLTHTVVLAGVTCSGPCNKNCPRNNALYWRECWLKRV